MDAAELSRWTRFAAKGGIGKCTAVHDCVAENPDDLMFMKDDEITVLMQLSETGQYLGHCEGVVGRFQGVHVRFHSKLKRPVITKRSSSTGSSIRSSPGSVSAPKDYDRDSFRSPLGSPIPTVSGPVPSSIPDSEDHGQHGKHGIGVTVSPSEDVSPKQDESPQKSVTTTSPQRPERTIQRRVSAVKNERTTVTTSPERVERIGPRDSRGSPVKNEPASLTPPVNAPSPEKTKSEHPQLSTTGSTPSLSTSESVPQLDRTLSTDDSDSSMSRVSAATSDGGELGIGLTMLQGMADMDDFDDESEEEEDMFTKKIGTPLMDKFAINSQAARAAASTSSPRSATPTSPITTTTAPPRQSSLYPSGSDTADDGEEWEGADDIYDDYRYSRFSMASKMSRISISKPPKGHGHGNDDTAPPIPLEPRSPQSVNSFDHFSRQSMGSQASLDPGNLVISPTSPALSAFGDPSKTPSERSQGTTPDPLVTTYSTPPLKIVKAPTPTTPSPTDGPPPRRVPPPLDLSASTSSGSVGLPLLSPASRSSRPNGLEFGNSPLLHTHFSSTSSSFGMSSPALSMSSQGSRTAVTTAGGAASALRQKLENERGLLSPNPLVEVTFNSVADPEERKIVIEDDEENTTIIHHTTLLGSPNRMSTSLSANLTHSPSTSSIADSQPSSSPRRPSSEIASSKPSTPQERSSSPTPAAASSNPAPPSPPQEPTSIPVVRPARNTSTGGSMRLQEAEVGHHAQSQQAQPQKSPSEQSEVSPPPQVSSSPPAQPESAGTTPPAQFPPHPNAPKPNLSAPGQRLGTDGEPPSHPRQLATAPGNSSLLDIMRMAAAPRAGPGGAARLTTIYGRTVVDLMNSAGPVGIIWSLEPMGSPAGPPGGQANNGSVRPGSPSHKYFPQRSATTMGVPSSPLRPSFDGARRSTTPLDEGNASDIERPGSAASGNVIPRVNFFPRVGVARPRSRSFSGFTTATAEAAVPVRRSDEEGPLKIPSVRADTRTTTGSLTPPIVTQLPRQQPSPPPSAPPQPSPARQNALSPLSLPQNNTTLSPRSASFKAPAQPSPLSRPPISLQRESISRAESAPTLDGSSNNRKPSLRQVASSITLRTNLPPAPVVSVMPPLKGRRNSGPAQAGSGEAAPDGGPGPAQSPTSPVERRVRTSVSSQQLHGRSVSQQSRTSMQRRGSVDTAASNYSDSRSFVTSPPPIGGGAGSGSSSSSLPLQRNTSLKSKLSLSALRTRNRDKDKDDVQTPTSSAPPTPITDNGSGYQAETVQVKDTDFELIRPNVMRRMSSERVSEESGRPSMTNNYDGRPDSPATSSLNSAANSRAYSHSDSGGERVGGGGNANANTKSKDGHTSMEAHRARELKWITAMSATPGAGSARRSKKVRKLLIEGVPSSVRYLVWAHLADSKQRRIPGVYAQLAKRGRVPVEDEVERDAKACFPEHPHLPNPKGPLVALLHAYLTMVPDVEYQTSLTIIAGHLLLQTPEEDAFWTFLSIMDTHLRSYFSPKSVQMEVDASLFSKAVEAADAPLAKRVFVDLDMSATQICRPWFSSLFATTLPPEYVNRVWDMFLYEGAPFLFRVALALMSLCRTRLFEPSLSLLSVPTSKTTSTTDRSPLYTLLARPPPSLLPPDPDGLINLAMNVKLKDDDVKKQRVKLEVQVKRQTQHSTQGLRSPGLSSNPVNPNSAVGTNISLPRS